MKSLLTLARKISLLVVILLGMLVRVEATSYIMPSWEELADRSEFIGVVECVTAGGIVARYKVIESWKGAKVGAEFDMSQRVDYWEPQFPIVLCGERFLAFGAKQDLIRIMSMSMGGAGVPLWWRKIPAEYRAASLTPLDDFTPGSLRRDLQAPYPTLEGFKADVETFLSASKDERERHLMLSEARRNLRLPDPSYSGARGDPDDKAVYDALSATTNVHELVGLVLGLARRIQVGHLKSVLRGVIDAGEAETLAFLDKMKEADFPWGEQELERAKSNLRPKLTRVQTSRDNRDESAEVAAPPPDAEKLKNARLTLLNKKSEYQSGEAFDLLLKHDPASVTSFLLDWMPVKDKWPPDDQFGYVLGSAFGHVCAKDRIPLLTTLCSAKNEWIRTAAAVYLCFDDLNAGTEQLRLCLSLPDDPGAWAAIVLASRGDKGVMERAMAVLATPMTSGMDSVNHGNLQKRLRVLMSNIAKTSGVPLPPKPSQEYAEGMKLQAVQTEFHAAIISWWKTHRDKIELRDPWLPVLESQKID